jgi:uncharacterized ion transporter superfamily protein YfcC
MVLLLGGVLVAALLTWLLPAGEYERRPLPDSSRELVVPGTWHPVEVAPVGLAQAVLAVPRGIVMGADVVVVVLFVGGAFVLLEHTGALGRLVGGLVGRTRRPRFVIVAISLAFATLGALVNMFEEIIALVPVLLVLSRGLGFGPVTALAMSAGAAIVGAAFGPTNPFASGIANRFAELPASAGAGVRLLVTVVAVTVWIAWTLSQLRHDVVADVSAPVTPAVAAAPRRDVVLLLLALVPFVPYLVGVLRFDWGFNELSAIYLVAAFAIGLVAGLGVRGTTVSYLRGMDAMLSAGLFVGVARAISVVLEDGRVIDTIVHGLAMPLEHVPGLLAAGLMVPIHALLHLPVASNSGHAALVMPIMAPLADLLGVSREVAVLAYQTGGPPMDLVVPTNGALLAMLLAARVPFPRWLRFALPGMVLVMLVGFAGMALALL